VAGTSAARQPPRLEESLLFANPAAGNFSQTGYDAEDAAVKMIGQFCTGHGVNGIANWW
jgi:hypothetical protein